MNPQSSAAADAIAALCTAVRVALDTDALRHVQVLDGPSAVDLENDAVMIGLGDPAVMTQRSEPDYGGRCTETGEIICVISCWDGSTDMAAKRARVYDILAAIEAHLRENPTLGDAVDDSMIGSDGELVQRQSSGALAALGFSVRYEAHI